MHLDVALVPAEAKRWSATVCILLDELRASSTIVTLLARGARAALKLWPSTPDIATVFRSSWSGHLLARHGFGDDIDFCVRVDATDTVPVVVRGDPLRIERLPG